MAVEKSTMTGCMTDKGGHMMMMSKEHPDGVMLMGSDKIDLKAYSGFMNQVVGTISTTGGTPTLQVASIKKMTGKCGAMAEEKSTMTGCMTEKGGHMMMMSTEHPDGVMLMGSDKIDLKAYSGFRNQVVGTISTTGGTPTLQVVSIKKMTGKCDKGSM
jgi:hypothetical protein